MKVAMDGFEPAILRWAMTGRYTSTRPQARTRLVVLWMHPVTSSIDKDIYSLIFF